MALSWVGVTRSGVAGAVCLWVSACGEPVRTDAALIEELRFNRAGFEEAIQVACETPAITDFELRSGQPPETRPASLDPIRVQSLRTFMEKHAVSRAYFECGSPVVASFDVASVGLGVSGQSKKLMFSPGGVPESFGGPLVADTDAAIAAGNGKSVTVHRDIGDGWFIRNSN